MILRETSIGALFPTLSARPKPQVWYTGSAVDQDVHEHGIVFARVRERAKRGDPGLAYTEYAAADDLETLDPDDVTAWYARTRRSESASTRSSSRLSSARWPRRPSRSSGWASATGLTLSLRIRPGSAARCGLRASADQPTEPDGRVVLSFDVRPDRKAATIAAAGVRSDGLVT